MDRDDETLVVSLESNGASVRVSVEDARRETRVLFEKLSREEGQAVAADAWDLGVQALAGLRRTPRKLAGEKPRKTTRLSTIPPSGW